jgi:hypothetical protein
VIRFAWRQARAQTAAAAAAIAVVAIIAAATGPHLARLYRAALAGCAPGGCPAAAAALAGQDSSLRLWLGVLVAAAPALLGMFWGAPLVARELEEGTFRLAWTQSITRTRWLITRLAVGGLASVAGAGLLSLIVTWWASPLDRAGLSQFAAFDERAIAPAGYAAFAFVLGAAAGALIRRTLPAMLATLTLFITARLTYRAWVRPALIPPVTRSLALNPASTGYGSQGFLPVALAARPTLQPSPPHLPGAWITSIAIVGRDGRGLTARELARACPGLGRGGPGGGSGHVQAPQSVATRMHDCVARVGATFHEVVSYQPGSRYWPLQWLELAVFLAAAAVLAGACLWRVRRLS